VTDPRTQATFGDVGGSIAESYCAACSQSFPADATHCPHDGSRLVKLRQQRDEMIGRVLDGRYEIRAPLGEGGMGTVYKGCQLSVDRDVAIKVVHPSVAQSIEGAKRFLREARLASRLNSPSIVNVYDFGQSDDGQLYLVMELVRGRSLAEEIDAGGAMPVKRALEIGLQLCDALDAAHSQGIVHRDFKPGNVLLVDGQVGRDLVKVLDFGLAKSVTAESASGLTGTHAMLGTPAYMAPEQIDGRQIDERVDLYALGCILTELVTGAPPFVDNTISALLAKHLTEEPAPLPPEIPESLSSLVAQLLSKAAAQRPAKIADVRASLVATQNELSYGHGSQPRIDLTPVPTRNTPRPNGAGVTPTPAGDIVRGSAPAVPMHSRPTEPAQRALTYPQAPSRGARKGVIAIVAAVAAAAGVAIVLVAAGGHDDPPKTLPSPPPPVSHEAVQPAQPTEPTVPLPAATIDAAAAPAPVPPPVEGVQHAAPPVPAIDTPPTRPDKTPKAIPTPSGTPSGKTPKTPKTPKSEGGPKLEFIPT
jgi:serine/threonine-protein kinase